MPYDEPNYDLSSLNLRAFCDSEQIIYHTKGDNMNPSTAIGLDRCPWCDASNNHAVIFYRSKTFHCIVCKKTASLGRYLEKEKGYGRTENGGSQAWRQIYRFRDRYTGPNTVVAQHQPAESLNLTGDMLLNYIGAYPDPIDEMAPYYRAHIEFERGLNFDYIKQKYDLHFTRPGDASKWAYRIVVPMHDAKGRQIVQATGRTYLKNAKPKYRDISTRVASVSSKNILFNLHRCKHDRPLIICEGVFDAIRFDGNAVAINTNNATDEQLSAMIGWPAVIVILDNDNDPTVRAATEKNARQIIANLLPFYDAHHLFIYKLPQGIKDLGELNARQIIELKRVILSQIDF